MVAINALLYWRIVHNAQILVARSAKWVITIIPQTLIAKYAKKAVLHVLVMQYVKVVKLDTTLQLPQILVVYARHHALPVILHLFALPVIQGIILILRIITVHFVE
jgi:hypothetical protein